MLYLSKGVVCKGSTEDKLHIARGNDIFILEDLEAEVWLEGRFKMVSFPDTKDYEDVILSLSAKGLAEFEYRSDAISQFRLLSRCICCPAKTKLLKKPLHKSEKTALDWLSNAGIRLTTAELTYLFENEILPTPSLMYEENQQALVETIYTQNNIYDNILENQMEKAKCRNEIVTVILMLLQKKRIVML